MVETVSRQSFYGILDLFCYGSSSSSNDTCSSSCHYLQMMMSSTISSVASESMGKLAERDLAEIL
jgi:hypothetical protein